MRDVKRAQKLILELKQLAEKSNERQLLNRLERLLNPNIEIDYKNEQWRDIINYEGLYQVSNMGRIMSLRENYKRIKRCTVNDANYVCVSLRDKNGKDKVHRVHRLVAEAFLPNLEKKPFVNHKNSIRSDNRVENLEWVSHKENIRHSFDFGYGKALSGVNHACAKLDAKSVRYMRDNFVPGDKKYGINAMARQFGVSGAVVHAIVHKKSYLDVE